MRTRTLTRQIVVRVPEELYEALEADADRNGRTMAQSVRWWLGGLVPTIGGRVEPQTERD